MGWKTLLYGFGKYENISNNVIIILTILIVRFCFSNPENMNQTR